MAEIYHMSKHENLRGDIARRRKKADLRGVASQFNGEVVAFGAIDLPTVIDTMDTLRSLEDQSFLDGFNTRDYHKMKSEGLTRG